MGTDESEVWNAFVESGRLSVGDRQATTAYLEYAADVDGGDQVEVEEHWPRWMPALGETVSLQSMRQSVETTMTAEGRLGVLRAYGNVLTTTDTEWVQEVWWERSFDGMAQRGDHVVFAVDVNLDPAGACVSVAWKRPDGGWHVEVVEYQGGAGSSWLEPKIKGLVEAWKPVGVVSVGGAPVRELGSRLKAFCVSRAVPFRSLSMQDYAAASQGLYEALRVESVTHGESLVLDDAVRRVRIKDRGELWAFDRRATRVDVSPLVSVSAALFGAQEADASRGRDEVGW
jgi:hypothetical protein